jgi:hypothetical protein
LDVDLEEGDVWGEFLDLYFTVFDDYIVEGDS